MSDTTPDSHLLPLDSTPVPIPYKDYEQAREEESNTVGPDTVEMKRRYNTYKAYSHPSGMRPGTNYLDCGSYYYCAVIVMLMLITVMTTMLLSRSPIYPVYRVGDYKVPGAPVCLFKKQHQHFELKTTWSSHELCKQFRDQEDRLYKLYGPSYSSLDYYKLLHACNAPQGISFTDSFASEHQVVSSTLDDAHQPAIGICSRETLAEYVRRGVAEPLIVDDKTCFDNQYFTECNSYILFDSDNNSNSNSNNE